MPVAEVIAQVDCGLGEGVRFAIGRHRAVSDQVPAEVSIFEGDLPAVALEGVPIVRRVYLVHLDVEFVVVDRRHVQDTVVDDRVQRHQRSARSEQCWVGVANVEPDRFFVAEFLAVDIGQFFAQGHDVGCAPLGKPLDGDFVP